MYHPHARCIACLHTCVASKKPISSANSSRTRTSRASSWCHCSRRQLWRSTQCIGSRTYSIAFPVRVINFVYVLSSVAEITSAFAIPGSMCDRSEIACPLRILCAYADDLYPDNDETRNAFLRLSKFQPIPQPPQSSGIILRWDYFSGDDRVVLLRELCRKLLPLNSAPSSMLEGDITRTRCTYSTRRVASSSMRARVAIECYQ